MANQYIQSSEDKKRAQALMGAIVFHALLLLLFIFSVFHTPIPPFPDGGSPGIEINFGTTSQGMGDVEANDIGNAQTEQEKEPQVKQEVSPVADNNVVTSNVEETDVSIPDKKKKPIQDKNPTPIKKEEEKKPEEKKPSNELANALNKFKNNKPGQSGGDGNSGKPGNEGDPNGSPNGDGGGGGGTGTGTGPGNGPDYSLSGRKMIAMPRVVDDSQAEGRVVVEITVDANGKVIQATAGARGSTTTSSVLYSKARQAALTAKFNAAQGTTEQKGTITFVFKLH